MASGAPPVGRDDELAALDRAVRALAGGRGGLVWIEGEPGIGKSTLVSAVSTGATELGCTTYRAVGDDLGLRLPLRALVDALGPAAGADVTAALHPDNAGLGSGTETAPAAVERFLVVIDRLCATAPVLLVFDDLQWADETSLLAWHRMSLAVDQIPLLLVAAARPVPARPAVSRLRRGVTSRGATLLALGPLPASAVDALVAARAGATPSRRLRDAVAHAGGNPLYTTELIDALVRDDRVTVTGDTADLVGTIDQVPLELTGAINARLDFLSTETTTTLRIAAMLGASFSVLDLATVTGRRTSALLSVLDEAIAAGVLAETGDRLTFRHGLLRQALYEATPAPARPALHRQIGRALADAGLPVGHVATHLSHAPDSLDGWAIDWLATHAAALAMQAPDLASELLRTASQQVDPDDPRQGALLRGRARALHQMARLPEAEAVARHALSSERDPARAAETAWTLATILHATARFTEALQVLDDALAGSGVPSVWRARLRTWRARALHGAGRRTEAEPEARWALAEGERLADPITVAHALHELYMLADYRTGLGHVRRALEVVGDRPDLAGLRLSLLTNYAYSLAALGETDAAEAAMRDSALLAERTGTWRATFVHAQMASGYVDSGRWDDAWAELLPLTGPMTLFDNLIRLGGLAYIAAHRDDRDTAESMLREADELPPLSGYMRGGAMLLTVARAVRAEQRGGAAAAVEVYRDTVAIEDGPDLYDRCVWLADVVRLALAVGDTDLARAAVAAAEADAAGEDLPRRRYAARAARARLDGDAAALLAVAADYRTTGQVLAFGQTAEEAAALLAAAGDITGARAALTDAVRAYLELGANWDVRRADARLRPLGVRRGPRSVRRRPTSGWESLTPTESRVAALVAEGRSNPDIAGEMLLSRRTVQTHVSNILTKLGLGSRLEIARGYAATPNE